MLYHLVINTGKVRLDQAVEIISRLVVELPRLPLSKAVVIANKVSPPQVARGLHLRRQGGLLRVVLCSSGQARNKGCFSRRLLSSDNILSSRASLAKRSTPVARKKDCFALSWFSGQSPAITNL